MIAENRLQDMAHSWGLGLDGAGNAMQRTPPAHIAREQVLELVNEVRRLNRVVAELKAEFGAITKNAVLTERERHIAEVRQLQTELADLQYGYDGLANAILVEGGENLLRKARREERERCAKLVDAAGASRVAHAIRALPDEESK